MAKRTTLRGGGEYGGSNAVLFSPGNHRDGIISRRPFTLFLVRSLGALLCLGLLSSTISSAWTIAKDSDSGPAADAQTLLRVAAKPANVTHPLLVVEEDGQSCSPPTVSAYKLLQDDPTSNFLSQLKRVNDTTGLAQAPVFTGKHKYLCSVQETRRDKGWGVCLPVSGRKDEPFCSGTDRRDLLVPQTRKTLCFSSVLHMLLKEVYETFHKNHGQPALVFGTLLGAIRDSAMIPFTEDADLGYQLRPEDPSLLDIKEILWNKGYHMFLDGVWRVCVAPTHPLARNLFDPQREAPVRDCGSGVPYVDLYAIQQHAGDGDGAGDGDEMEKEKEKEEWWSVQEARHRRRFVTDKIVPYAQVHINGDAFDTLADPKDFLLGEYGPEYMTPQPRNP